MVELGVASINAEPEEHQVTGSKLSRTVDQVLDELFPEVGSIHGDRSERMHAFRRSARVFERLVTEILVIQKRGDHVPSPEQMRVSRGFQFDVLFPTGLLDFEGPTAVEVYSTWPGVTVPLHASLRSRLVKPLFECIAGRIPVLVIVANTPFDDDARQAIARLTEPLDGLRVVLWGPAELQHCVEQAGEQARRLLANAESVEIASAIRNATRGDDSGWRDDRNAILLQLHQAWREENLCLFVGAGVSVGAGVPTWASLLGSLFGTWIDRMAPQLAGNEQLRSDAAARLLQIQDNSPLMTARHIRSGLGDDFKHAIRETLYSNVDTQPSKVLTELAALCDPPRGRLGVRAVVTYNFDDLLEKELDVLHVRYTSVYSPGERPEAETLPLYHVHGFIPRAGDLDALGDQSLVFSEEAYHVAYNNPYTWSNIVQLNLLSEQTCVFIGLSMTDPNLRRLLDIASRAGGDTRHVAFLRRTPPADLRDPNACGMDEGKCERPPSVDVDERVARVVLAAHHEVWEESLREFNVRVLWFEEFDELPGLLEKISSGQPN